MVIYPGGAAGTFIANLIIATIDDCKLQMNMDGSMDFTNPAVSNLKINLHNADLIDRNHIMITNCVDVEFLQERFLRRIINVSFDQDDVQNISDLYWLKTIKNNPILMRSWPHKLYRLIKNQKQLDVNQYDFSDPVLNQEIFQFGYSRLIDYHLHTEIPSDYNISFKDIFSTTSNLENIIADITNLPVSDQTKQFIKSYRETNWVLYPFLQTYKNKGK